MGRLENKICVVTGAARGMGETTARLFASEGAHVALVDILDDVQAIAKDIGKGASFFQCDITRESDWQSLCEQLVSTHGTIDILVNNAASIQVADLLSLEKQDFMRLLDINLLGAWLGMKILGGQMVAQGKGSIVNILSVGALQGINGMGAYVASKWGLRGLTHTAAMEFGPKGVRVNSVCPGGIASPMANVDDASDDLTNWRMAEQPIARIGQPEEVAQASLFLASDEASYMSGAELVVDGGMMNGTYREYLPAAPEAFVRKRMATAPGKALS